MDREITNLADGSQPASFGASQNRPTNEAEIADANPDGKSRSLPRAACAPRRFHHPQSLGRRHGQTARRDGVRGAGDHEPRRCQHAGQRHRQPRCDHRELPGDRRRHRPARQRRPGEWRRGRSEDRGESDRARGGGRLRRRLDRGFHRQSARADLRFLARGRARAGGRRGGARAALPVHADGAGGEFPARPQGSRRYHQAAAGVRGGWRRRAVFARPVRPRHHPHRGVIHRQAVQSGDGLCRPDADARSTLESRRQAHQRRRRNGALRACRVLAERPRDEGSRRVHLCARDGADRRRSGRRSGDRSSRHSGAMRSTNPESRELPDLASRHPE